VEELGVNLAGVEVILHMRDQMERLQQDSSRRACRCNKSTTRRFDASKK
jgi:hypothetical protein